MWSVWKMNINFSIIVFVALPNVSALISEVALATSNSFLLQLLLLNLWVAIIFKQKNVDNFLHGASSDLILFDKCYPVTAGKN